MKKRRLLICSLSLLCSCVTPKPVEEPKAIVPKASELSLWTAKAQVKDLKTDKSQQVSLDLITMLPNSVRVDVSGPLGISLATLTIQKDQIQYALYRQKSFYEGIANEKAMRSIFRMDLDARHLVNICYDQPILEKGWKCQNGAQGLVESCENIDRGLSVFWKERDGFKKRVVLSNHEHEVQILFKEYSTKVLDENSNQKDPFHIEIPEGFQHHKIL